MFSEICLEEMRCYSNNGEIEKAFDQTIKKIKNLNISEIHGEKEMIDKVFKTLEIGPELKEYFKNNFVVCPILLLEEHFKKGILIGKEFYPTEQKQH